MTINAALNEGVRPMFGGGPVSPVVTCRFCEPEGGDHGCHCVNVRRRGVVSRVAVGICCGRSIGDNLLREEDAHSGMPWAQPGDCTCWAPLRDWKRRTWKKWLARRRKNARIRWVRWHSRHGSWRWEAT